MAGTEPATSVARSEAPPRFVDQVLAAAAVRPMHENPFIEHLTEGAYPRKALALYGTELHAKATVFPRRIAALLARPCPEALRVHLLQNLLEEEGFVPAAGGGLRYDPARRHPALSARLAHALGASRAEIEAAALPPDGWLEHEIAAGSWLAAAAYLMVGLEANVPRTFSLLLPPLRDRYRIAEADLEFLTEHLVADERHGVEGAGLLAASACTLSEREAVLTGARRGGLGWWWWHRRCHERLTSL